MTELDIAIAAAFKSQGQQTDVNKVYLLLLRTTLYLPVRKDHAPTDEEPFAPLFANIQDHYYLMAFDTLDRLDAWTGEHKNEISYVELSGHDLIKGINDEVCFCLNMGTPYYKEFLPDEVKRLKTIVSKIEQMKKN